MGLILIIEDVQDNFELLEDALESWHCLAHAKTGYDGLAQARSLGPDLILLDMGLPGMDGWEVVKHLKADRELAGIPVIALTAHAMRDDRARCLDAGCDAYLPKPIRIQELMELLRRFVSEVEPAPPSAI